MLNGRVVEGSEIVVSVDESEKILKVYNNSNVSVSINKTESIMPLISQDQALDLAWKHLKVNGELLKLPTAKLIYTTDLKLVYKIQMSTSSPFGHHALLVDAHSGKVLEVK